MSDKTYAETRGSDPFDWNKWLDQSILVHPEKKDWEEKKLMASEWTTCACGNSCAIIPRHKETCWVGGNYVQQGEPVDDELSQLGMRFYDLIQYGRFASAKEKLGEIEARAKVLITKELERLNS